MPVEDVFSISGRGTVATGRVESGVLKTGDEIEIIGIRETKKSVCTGVEMFRKLLDSGEAGDNVGVLLRGVERTDIERGQVLCKPGSVTPHTCLLYQRFQFRHQFLIHLTLLYQLQQYLFLKLKIHPLQALTNLYPLVYLVEE